MFLTYTLSDDNMGSDLVHYNFQTCGKPVSPTRLYAKISEILKSPPEPLEFPKQWKLTSTAYILWGRNFSGQQFDFCCNVWYANKTRVSKGKLFTNHTSYLNLKFLKYMLLRRTCIFCKCCFALCCLFSDLCCGLGFLVDVLVLALFYWGFIVAVTSLGFFYRCWVLCVYACAHKLGKIFLIFLFDLSEFCRVRLGLLLRNDVSLFLSQCYVVQSVVIDFCS